MSIESPPLTLGSTTAIALRIRLSITLCHVGASCMSGVDSISLVTIASK